MSTPLRVLIVSFAVIAVAFGLAAAAPPGSRSARPARAVGPPGGSAFTFGLDGLDRVWAEKRWYAGLILHAELDRQETERARAAAARRSQGQKVQPRVGTNGTGFPGECIIDHESRSAGTYTAQNPSSTASGAYQILDSTWAGYQGYTSAKDAPAAVQDQRARDLWQNGRGGFHWNGTGCPGTG